MKRDKRSADSSEMFERLVRNALDFLERSVDELKDSPKYAVIDFCTAIELFLKARLLLEHWALVYEDPKLANQDKFREGDFKSVGIADAIARLTNICGQGINTQQRNAFERIRDHRNRLVHFFDPVAVEDVTAELCLGLYHLTPLLLKKWDSHFASYVFELALIDRKMHRNREFLRVKYEARAKDIEQGKAKGALFLNCPSCGFEAMRKEVIAGPVVSADCLICRAAGPGLEIECPGCRAPLRGHLYMVCQCSRPITLDDVLHGYPTQCNREENPEKRLAYCGDSSCFSDTSWQGDVGPDETRESVVLFDDKWICLGCFAVEKGT